MTRNKTSDAGAARGGNTSAPNPPAPASDAPAPRGNTGGERDPLPSDASPTRENANTSTSAEEVELNQTVNEDGTIRKNSTGSNTTEGDDSTTGSRSSGPPAPGTDNSTAETIRVKTTGDFLFQDPFLGVTVDNTDDGGNKDGIIKSAMVQTAIDDGRLEEIGGKSRKSKDD